MSHYSQPLVNGSVVTAAARTAEWQGAVGGTAVFAPTTDTLYYTPIVIRSSGTADRIGVELTASGDASSVARLGIYRDNGNVFPGQLLLDAGTTNTGVAPAGLMITISRTLTSGSLVWLAFVAQTVTAAATFRAVNGQSYLVPPTGLTNTGHIARTQTGVTGALPSTASPIAVTTNSPRTEVRWA